MTIRFLSIATLLFYTCLYATAQNVVVKEVEGPVVDFDLRDFAPTCELSANPLKVRQHTPEFGDAIINYEDRITNLPDYLHDFLKNYVEAANIVLDGGTSWLSDPFLAESSPGVYYYTLKEISGDSDFTFSINSTDAVIDQAAQSAVSLHADQELDRLQSFMPYTFLAAKYDHPEVFWIGNVIRYSYSYSYSYPAPDTSNGTGTVSYTITFKLHLRSSNYDIRGKGTNTHNFRNTTTISKGVENYHSLVQSVLEQCQSESRYWKLRKAYDWLTTHNCYNHLFSLGYYTRNDIGDMPWCPLSALEGKTGTDLEAPVCEGYARAMKVLCDEMGIPCILMSGNAMLKPTSEPVSHMWNYVQMEDGNWYAVDPTWDDPQVPGSYKVISGYESHTWFLVGSFTEGMEVGWPFILSHPEQWLYTYTNDGSYSWELEDGPALYFEGWHSPTPYDPNADGITDLEDIYLMAEKIANNKDDIEDVDGNNRITIGDLVNMINKLISE